MSELFQIPELICNLWTLQISEEDFITEGTAVLEVKRELLEDNALIEDGLSPESASEKTEVLQRKVYYQMCHHICFSVILKLNNFLFQRRDAVIIFWVNHFV